MATQFWTLRTNGETFRLASARDLSQAPAYGRVDGPHAAMAVQTLSISTPILERRVRDDLLAILAAVDWLVGSTEHLSTQALQSRVAEALVRGNIVAFRTSRPAVVEQHRKVEFLGPTDDQTSWIEIELLDQDKKPVPNERYVIKTSDGRKIEGTTNASGKAREEGLVPGDCDISFPDLEAAMWAAA
jgi:hypothetical protein